MLDITTRTDYKVTDGVFIIQQMQGATVCVWRSAENCIHNQRRGPFEVRLLVMIAVQHQLKILKTYTKQHFFNGKL